MYSWYKRTWPMRWWHALWPWREIIALQTKLHTITDMDLPQARRVLSVLGQVELVKLQRELSNCHAALRRKGKALKELHKRVQYHKEKRP